MTEILDTPVKSSENQSDCQPSQERTLFIANIPREVSAQQIEELINYHLGCMSHSLSPIKDTKMIKNSIKNKKVGSKKSRLFAFAQTSAQTIACLRALSPESSIQLGGKSLFFDQAKISRQETYLRFSRSVQMFFYAPKLQKNLIIKTLVKQGLLIEWFNFQQMDDFIEIRLRLGDDASVSRLLQVSRILFVADGLHFKSFVYPDSHLSNELYQHRLHFRLEWCDSYFFDSLDTRTNPRYQRCQKSITHKPLEENKKGPRACGCCLARRKAAFANASCTNYRLNRKENKLSRSSIKDVNLSEKRPAWRKDWLIVKTSQKNKLLITNDQISRLQSYCIY